jgi:glycosyltransferase involved in cell wall biosynthesis
VIRKPENAGAHDSLNIGLAQARGDYIAIANSDDSFAAERIARILATMRENQSQFGFSLVAGFLDSKTMKPGGQWGDDVLPSDVFSLFVLRQTLALARDVTTGFALLRRNIAISTGNFVFSAALGRRIGGFLPLKYCHDWDFALQALVLTEPVCVMEPLYRYRLHAANSFRGLRSRAIIESEVALRRFFRAVLNGTENVLCPSPSAWPGYFEQFLRESKLWHYWAIESGHGLPQWRTIAAPETEPQEAGFALQDGSRLNSLIDALYAKADG